MVVIGSIGFWTFDWLMRAIVLAVPIEAGVLGVHVKRRLARRALSSG